ncbi:hypothetical protein D3C80_2034560 [compost metagenome]
MVRYRFPTLVVNRTMTDHFIILCASKAHGFTIIEGIGQADTLDRLLLHSINVIRRFDPYQFQNSGHYINNMMILTANPPSIFNPVRIMKD